MLSLDAGLAERCGADALRPVAEAVANVVLPAERLHHLDPDDCLVGRLGHVSLPRLHLARDRRDAMPEAVGDVPDRRQGDCRVERQPRVDEYEDDSGRDDHHHALHPLHEPPADEVPDWVEVVRRPRQHLTGRVPVVEGARVAEIRLVEELAHPRLDPHADPRRREATTEVDDEADRRQSDDDRQVRPERLPVVVGADVDGVVDRPLDENRDRDRDQRVEKRAREPEDAEAPLLTPELEQPAEGRQQAEVGRIDGIHVRRHGEIALAAGPQPGATSQSTIPAARAAALARSRTLCCCGGAASSLPPARDLVRWAAAATGSEAVARPPARARWETRTGGALAAQPRLLLLELDAQAGKLPLDPPNRLLPLVEPLPLGLREGELLDRLALALLGLRDLLRELARTVGTGWSGSGSRSAPASLPTGDIEPELLELLLSRGDVCACSRNLRFMSSTSASACS